MDVSLELLQVITLLITLFEEEFKFVEEFKGSVGEGNTEEVWRFVTLY